ncbi:MAG: helix-turn-helix domain-containing protein [Anaerolineae bacterium]|nr:helix-turn-helix domain-containing protein [Anaerolineae bacterium]
MRLEGWISTTEAADLTGYTVVYIRYLARSERIEAVKTGRDWLINRASLLAYKARMDALGTQKHNPWREDANE